MKPSPTIRVPEAAIARLGLALRDAQKVPTEKLRKNKPRAYADALAAAREQQERFDALCRQAPYSPLAKLGITMRDAQRAHAVKRAKLPESQCDAERRRAYALQAEFERRCREVLEAEQPVLPGMGEGGDH